MSLKASYLAEWKQNHPESIAAYRAREKAKFKADPEKVALHNERNLNNYHRTRYAIFDILGHECARCGFNDYRALQVDHIHGGGNKQRMRVNSLQYFREILQDPNIKLKYQTLCSNCNWIKRAENNENSKKRLGNPELEFGTSGLLAVQSN